jgi:ornithine carbamoyltransferase
MTVASTPVRHNGAGPAPAEGRSAVAMKRHLLTIGDLTDAELRQVVTRAAALAAGAPVEPVLAGRTVGLHFRKASARTRAAFEQGARRLGAHVVGYGPDDPADPLDPDGGAVLDILVLRTGGEMTELETLADLNRMSIVNAMCAAEHPTQALSDLATMMTGLGKVDGLRVLYLGEGNNAAVALTLALSRFRGVELHLRTPAGHGLPPATVEQAGTLADRSGSLVIERHDTASLPRSADVVCTTRWRATGLCGDPARRARLAPFQVNRQIMAQYPEALLMHDSPALHGGEITAEVLDGPQSVTAEQAANKLHGAIATLEWCVG